MSLNHSCSYKEKRKNPLTFSSDGLVRIFPVARALKNLKLYVSRSFSWCLHMARLNLNVVWPGNRQLRIADAARWIFEFEPQCRAVDQQCCAVRLHLCWDRKAVGAWPLMIFVTSSPLFFLNLLTPKTQRPTYGYRHESPIGCPVDHRKTTPGVGSGSRQVVWSIGPHSIEPTIIGQDATSYRGDNAYQTNVNSHAVNSSKTMNHQMILPRLRK